MTPEETVAKLADVDARCKSNTHRIDALDGKAELGETMLQMQLAVAELAEVQAADQTANELALAELAEIVVGG